VLTLALPSHVRSIDVCRRLRREGYLLNYQSEYLLRRNWIQICLMGEWEEESLRELPEALEQAAMMKPVKAAALVDSGAVHLRIPEHGGGPGQGTGS
jgi:hypothetical protein